MSLRLAHGRTHTHAPTNQPQNSPPRHHRPLPRLAVLEAAGGAQNHLKPASKAQNQARNAPNPPPYKPDDSVVGGKESASRPRHSAIEPGETPDLPDDSVIVPGETLHLPHHSVIVPGETPHLPRHSGIGSADIPFGPENNGFENGVSPNIPDNPGIGAGEAAELSHDSVIWAGKTSGSSQSPGIERGAPPFPRAMRRLLFDEQPRREGQSLWTLVFRFSSRAWLCAQPTNFLERLPHL